jgi:hypothetical protein
VQLTPPGSMCSTQIGTGLTNAPPGSAQMTYLAVSDIEAAHEQLAQRGVNVGAIRHKSPPDEWKGAWALGTHPSRRDYASVFDLVDPDGNTWLVQEICFRPAEAGQEATTE